MAGHADVELTEKGKVQAKIVAEKLANEQLDVILCSPLDRAQETANIINSGRTEKLPIIITNSLMEVDYGIYEGVKKSNFNYKQFWNYLDENNTNSFFSFAWPIIRFIYGELLTKYYDQNILLVTHGGVSKIFEMVLGDYSLSPTKIGTYLPDNSELLIYNISKNNSYYFHNNNSIDDNENNSFFRIISKEDFEKAQKILDSHSKAVKIGLRQAKGVPKNMWSKKLLCECGSTFNRRTYHRNKYGTTYSYECYKRKNSLEKECKVKGIPEWKLEYMAKHIFTCLTRNKENREELTKILMEGVKLEENEEKNIKNEIKRYKNLIDDENTKLDRILDMYLDETVDLKTFEQYQKKSNSKIETFKVEIDELEKQIKRLEPVQVRKEKALKSVRKILDVGYNGIDERLIEEVVEKIIVHENYFEWKLNFYDETFKLKITGKGQKDCFVEEYK